MEQSAGLASIRWISGTVDKIIGETSSDGSEVLTLVEELAMFASKLSGGSKEARAKVVDSKFTVDFEYSEDLVALLKNTVEKNNAGVVYGGMNNGKTAKTGKIVIHPLYAGADKSEDITLFKCVAVANPEITYSADGKKLLKVEFTVLSEKVTVATGDAPTVTDGAGTDLGADEYHFKIQLANDWSEGKASLTGGVKQTKAGATVEFGYDLGTNRVILFRSNDNFVSNIQKYELTVEEVSAKKVENVETKTFTTATLPSVDNVHFFYSQYKIGE